MYTEDIVETIVEFSRGLGQKMTTGVDLVCSRELRINHKETYKANI